jgi:hypothetical protein
MTDVPSNLIPTRITQLPDAPVASPDGLLLFVYQGNSYKVRAGDLLSVAGVPTSRQVIAGTALTGGGALSSNVTLSVANNGIGTTQLANSGVTSGTYGDSTNIPVFTVDATGRVTSATTIALSVTGYVPLATQVIAGTGLTGGGTLNNNVTLTVNLSSSLPIVGDVSGVAGVATTSSRSDHQHPSVNLADNDQVNGLVGLQHGGTAKSLVADAGAMIWSGADGLYVGPAGVAGQVLVSGGTSAPTWGSVLLVVDQPANVVYAGPVSGASAPTTFRSLVNADLPTSGVAANTYGSSTTVPVITVNSKGVITTVTESTIIGTISYKGAWNANTNFPVLTSSVGTNGFYYVVTTAGTTNLNGITDWQIGDWAIFNGTVWQKIDQTNTVTSVNGQTGAVSVGTVTSVAMTVPTGLSISGTPITTSGTLALTLAAGYSIPTNVNQTNWTTAYTQTQQWNGDSTNLVSATGRTSLGGTTVGQSMFTLTNPSAITFPRFNADNTVSALNAADFRTAIGAGSGTVSSVSVTSANGFAGTVANPSSTPAITLTTSITGVLKGNGTAISAATSGTDYSLGTSALATGILKSTTTTGALTIAVAADFPTLNQNTTGTATATNGLKTATTTVVINSATAPSNGQVLTATSSTAATWQTPTVGTVTSVSVVSANGFTGTSSGGATPALTLTTSITGVLKGNGTALSVATSGTDYSLGTSALATGIVKSTTTTGALTIAIAADFPTLNQNTSGTAAGLSATLVIGSGGTGTVYGVNGGTF